MIDLGCAASAKHNLEMNYQIRHNKASQNELTVALDLRQSQTFGSDKETLEELPHPKI